MALFKQSVNTQAFLKAGIMGFAGAGKTYTASQIAVGLIGLLRERDIPGHDKPVMILDTETGSDWVKPVIFDPHGVELFTAKTRAFTDLVPAVLEAEANGSIIIIDSITHFWKELTESYAEKKNRTRGLQFSDWAYLKKRWGQFTDTFINSNTHIIMCGRAGYEYDFFVNDDGKKELEKTGIKMKAETETGYEPSILMLMDKHIDMDTKKVYRTATILKDRADKIDGKVFRNPTFEDFLPHINLLNLGGQQLGVDTSRSSKDDIPHGGKSDWEKDKLEKEIVLDEIQAIMVKYYPGTTKEDKAAKGALAEKHFGTRSWKRIETYSLQFIKDSYNTLHEELEGKSAYFKSPTEELGDIPDSIASPDGRNALIARLAEVSANGFEELENEWLALSDEDKALVGDEYERIKNLTKGAA